MIHLKTYCGLFYVTDASFRAYLIEREEYTYKICLSTSKLKSME